MIVVLAMEGTAVGGQGCHQNACVGEVADICCRALAVVGLD